MRPLILIILDGFGIGDKGTGDAVNKAQKHNLDKIFRDNPITFISASGQDVGLPKGQMGNSEVGHTNIGAGRIVYQDFTRITKAIEDRTFFDNEKLNNIMRYVKNSGGKLHITGLLSDGGVHSHISHLNAILDLAKSSGIKNICVHAWLDGRDVSPTSGVKFVENCEKILLESGIGRVETISGRFYAMDRDNRWERITKAYDAMVNANGRRFVSPTELVNKSYQEGVTDEFIEPSVRDGYSGLKEEDAVICFNFRPDRAREITRAFVDREIKEIKCDRVYPGKYLCFTQYDAEIQNVEVVFEAEKINNTLGKYISEKGLKQLRIAETEKYAHVTFFFNGGDEKPLEGEDRILVSSPKVKTYDLKPEMSAYEVTDKVIKSMEEEKYDLIILNYANCDMVGHTGVFSAAVKAVEAVDDCIGKLVKTIYKMGYSAIITADHGNAEKMLAEDGKPFTAHTTNLVPFCVINYKCSLSNNGRLADISPTILNMLGLEKPNEMTGESLIQD